MFLLKDQILSRTTTVMEALLETGHEATMMLKKKILWPLSYWMSPSYTNLI